jgi:hypothetical protein
MSKSAQADLAWIAAILRPQDVMSLRGKPDASFDKQLSTKLADLMMAKPKLSGEPEYDQDPEMTAVANSFLSEKIRDGIVGLSEIVDSSMQIDPAKACAFALLACTACGELEEYDKCDSILSGVLDRLGKSASHRLIRAILLQQRCLRMRDASRLDEQDIVAVAELLHDLTADDLPPFAVNSIAISSRETIGHILTALRRSNWSMVSPLRLDQSADLKRTIPTWDDQARFPESEQLLIINSEVAKKYADLIEKQYQSRRKSSGFSIGQDAVPDLFFQLIRLELLGTASVVGLRRQLAQIRLLRQPYETAEEYYHADSLRLLRQAGAETDLDIAIERIIQEGPLSSLSIDARQILRRPYDGFRTTELRVLRSAADLLSESEARVAMDGLMQVDLPPNLAGHWQSDSVRLGSLWRTISALSNVANKVDRATEFLLSVVENCDSEAIITIDSAVSRSIRTIDWEQVSQKAKERWRVWISSAPAGWSEVREAVRYSVNAELAVPEIVATLDDVVQFVNSLVFDEEEVSEARAADAISIVQSSLSQIRESAKKGSYSFGSYDAADIGVLLAAKTGSLDLWQKIVELLTDNRVARSDKTAAFERLARLRPNLPESTSALFRQMSSQILDPPNRQWFQKNEINPYPAALRFLAAYKFMPPFEVFAQIGRLSGQPETDGVREAAATIAVLASGQSEEWFLAIALQLSYSADAAAKADAGRALALLAEGRPEYATLVSQRLLELLSHDGFLIPIKTLRNLPAVVPPTVREKIIGLHENHPSKKIRSVAGVYLST